MKQLDQLIYNRQKKKKQNKKIRALKVKIK